MAQDLHPFAYRTGTHFAMKQGTVVLDEVANSNVRMFKYSADGRYVAFSAGDCVTVSFAESGKVAYVLQRPNVLDISFSPNGNYVALFERYAKPANNNDPPTKNVTLFKTEDGSVIIGFTQRNQPQWELQWTMNESLFARLVTNEVHFYDLASVLQNGPTAGSPTFTLRIEGVTRFALAPGDAPFHVAAFVPERKGAPASLRIYAVAQLTTPVAQKSFFKADQIQLMWSPTGKNLLALTQTEVDQSGQSYYGETNLYFLAAHGSFDARVALDKSGAIHDVAWNPNGREFIVVYGYTPASAKLFDLRCNPVFDFGAAPRNHVQFSATGQLICIAGFGNLAGDMDFWDREKLTKLTTVQASGSSYCEWAPDGRSLMTAVLSPRLRVDNGFTIWHHRGHILAREQFKELFQVQWRPVKAGTFKPRALSPPRAATSAQTLDVSASTNTAAAKPTAYRPPHLRNQPPVATTTLAERVESSAPSVAPASQRSNVNTSNAPTSTSDANLSKTALKNKKKREQRKAAEESELEKLDPAQKVSMVIEAAAEAAEKKAVAALNDTRATTGDPEADRKIRNIEKKLKQISDLKQVQANGGSLELNQIQKIATEQDLIKSIDALTLTAKKQ